jgi:hypothetical protein
MLLLGVVAVAAASAAVSAAGDTKEKRNERARPPPRREGRSGGLVLGQRRRLPRPGTASSQASTSPLYCWRMRENSSSSLFERDKNKLIRPLLQHRFDLWPCAAPPGT